MDSRKSQKAISSSSGVKTTGWVGRGATVVTAGTVGGRVVMTAGVVPGWTGAGVEMRMVSGTGLQQTPCCPVIVSQICYIEIYKLNMNFLKLFIHWNTAVKSVSSWPCRSLQTGAITHSWTREHGRKGVRVVVTITAGAVGDWVVIGDEVVVVTTAAGGVGGWVVTITTGGAEVEKKMFTSEFSYQSIEKLKGRWIDQS